ncbi:hypothetical protein GGTG_09501 [Gaeumannomyces tritici R3-111a-1]|uniref:Uncharacterized protein n=1 Tax=Gaeumannomyces tritici (strain R3-111a-1) TaxID=644352 RepID=J3P7K9_GAET3|nr:hypothetical protein GGTG_09501 [Gaeumannomyces tritici R3-111a-1]EJT72641.1 hypothetical protein GGTG_09501 [Gaeumannomyces tritici R3-111a-1]
MVMLGKGIRGFKQRLSSRRDKAELNKAIVEEDAMEDDQCNCSRAAGEDETHSNKECPSKAKKGGGEATSPTPGRRAFLTDQTPRPIRKQSDRVDLAHGW